MAYSQPFEDPDATFIRSASFRSEDTRHMIKVYENIMALKKAATKREAERKELADVVKQEKLIELRGEAHMDNASRRTTPDTQADSRTP
jgi:nucleosome binding factor SPN SPT16 subunit